MNNSLWLVVPCYNEKPVIVDTADALLKLIVDLCSEDVISDESKIVFVDDGSSDGTWEEIEKLCVTSSKIVGIKLSHNQGHQNALLAGMMYAKDKCDCIITIDADLQDDIYAIPEFIKKYQEGCHVVYGVRKKRETDTVFKRTTAHMFYRFMNTMGVETVYNHADYRLLSNKALNALENYKETNLFLRGIVPLMGFKSDSVFYDRKARTAGETKYPFKKMLNFAFDGITSFSVKPLRVISFIGMLSSLLSLSGLVYALVSHFCGVTVPGWTAIVCSIWLLGGIQLLSIGVLGEYIGKIFSEVKQRPRYFIDEIVANDEYEK